MQPASASFLGESDFFSSIENACVDRGGPLLTLERGDQLHSFQRLISMKQFFFSCSAALVLVSPVLSLAADPTAEMAEFSVFGRVDRAALAKGEVRTAPGVPMQNERYLSVQTCYAIPQPPAKVIAAMKNFDPSAHRDLKVVLHSDLSSSPSAADFSKLEHLPNIRAAQNLRTATEKMSPNLQISQAEAQTFSPGKSVFAFWGELLAKRVQAFVAGGASAEPPYDHTRNSIQAGKELAGLVRQQAKVNRQFGSFLASTGFLGGRGSLKPELYWELLEVETDGVLALGANYNRSTSGGGYQVADGFYYASGGFYVSLTLQQFWPIELSGRPSTLVWRGDFTSASSLGELHGIERLASEGAMRKNIQRAATIFQREASR